MHRLTLPALLFVAAAGVGGALAQAAEHQATLIVRVPAEAQLIIGSQSTSQTGRERRFVSPELVPGYDYSYQLEASWVENGREKKAQRTVRFRPGETAVVDFLTKDLAAQPQANQPAPPPVSAPVDQKGSTKAAASKNDGQKQRSFRFVYAGTVTDLKPGQQAKVWLPVAETTEEQQVKIEEIKTPAPHKMGEDKQYSNRMIYFEAAANDRGEIPFQVTYRVTREEVKTNFRAGATLKPRESQEQVTRFLQPDAKVPVEGKPLELLHEQLKNQKLPPDQFQAAKVLYDVVNNHMRYSKDGTGWGQGDAVWACDSRFGNCTDFHSLFISMARGNKIPAKFEMGFSIPPKRGEGVVGGYHCWAWFMPEGKGWIPVDISEADRFPEMNDYYFGNLTEDRVQFTTGRDINLTPRQSGPPLNFFVYPYVEVNGQAYPAEKIQRSFSYRDL